MSERIDLNQKEIKQLNLRLESLAEKQSEVIINQESLEFCFKNLLVKYGLEGVWSFDGEGLTKQEVPEDGRPKIQAVG